MRGHLLAGTTVLAVVSLQLEAAEQLLKNPAFESNENGIEAWSYSQHAGDISYEYEGSEGVLTIRRTGVEPWGLLAQEFQAQPLAGQTLQLTLEVQGDFVASDTPVFEPASVNLLVQGWPQNPAMRFMGLQMLGESRYQLPQDLPGGSWQPVALSLVVPETAVSVELTLVMGYQGEMRVRNPVLRVAAAGAQVDAE